MHKCAVVETIEETILMLNQTSAGGLHCVVRDTGLEIGFVSHYTHDGGALLVTCTNGEQFMLNKNAHKVLDVMLGRVTSPPIPIPMRLFCPKCHAQHIDKADPEPPRNDKADALAYGMGVKPKPRWTNPPHKSHLCEKCGCVWRPADVHTTGVAEIETRGKDDSFPELPVSKEWECVATPNEFDAILAKFKNFCIIKDDVYSPCKIGDTIKISRIEPVHTMGPLIYHIEWVEQVLIGAQPGTQVVVSLGRRIQKK